MNAIIAQALAPFAPRNSEVHQVLQDNPIKPEAVDRAMLLSKLAGDYAKDAQATAMRLQVQANPSQWGIA